MSEMTNAVKKFWKDEEGLQTLEILLIVAVIVVIALMFRTQIMEWVNSLFDFGNDQIDQIRTGS